MGALRGSHGELCILWADHLIGRAPPCALRLSESSISWRHASLRWTGLAWELQDLGSRNGTFVDDERIAAGARVVLRMGSRLRFGRVGDEWVLCDSSPPLPSVVALDSGERVFSQDGLIALPSGDHPELSIYQRPDGAWVAEHADRIWEPRPNEVLLADGRQFQFEPGTLVSTTAAGPTNQPTLGTIALEFVVSRDEEHVDLTIVHAGRRTQLRPRAHTYLLLTLARVRIQDQGDAALPPSSHGWIGQEKLIKMLATSPPQLAVDIYRARRQLGEAGVLDAPQVIERRVSSRELRLGVAQLSVIAG